jgi:type IV pilus assembly protein PilQ
MEYFQSIFKHQRRMVAGVVLAFVLALGCSTHNTENMSEPAGAKEKAVGSEADAGTLTAPAVTGVRVVPEADKLTVWVQGTAPMTYTSIKQAFPFGIAVYLPDTTLKAGLVPEPVNDSDISGISLGYADQAETTAKVEIFLNNDLPYTVREEQDALGIVIEKQMPRAEINSPGPASDQAMTASETLEKPVAHDLQEMLPVKTSEGPAELTYLTFDTMPTGQSDIRVSTSHPVKYEARQAGPDHIHLVLFNTRIPKIHQRPLLTRYFNSAVVEVQPKVVSGADAYLDIKIREQVPYQLVQTRDGIHMAFEPSSVSPPEFDKAKVALPGTRAAAAMADGSPAVMPDHTLTAAAARTSPEEALLGKPPVYTGEKIKLDFYDTDIKNVFRILRSVSGLNFAIDDDVQGKVTLSLEEPVPWDQVMDLVLKMNGLGKKMEGNVVRIATLKTMADEEKAIQNAIAARKKSLEQKESLAPLVTEYIPINYSDATKDIQPHVQQIFDQGPGTALRGHPDKHADYHRYPVQNRPGPGPDLPPGQGDPPDHDRSPGGGGHQGIFTEPGASVQCDQFRHGNCRIRG